MEDVCACACTWGDVSIDFGGGALYYFHRFIPWWGRYVVRSRHRCRCSRRGKTGFVAIYKTHPRAETNSGGETSFQPMRMHFERNGGRSVVFTRHASQSLHASYIAKISERLPSRDGEDYTSIRIAICVYIYESAFLYFFFISVAMHAY